MGKMSVRDHQRMESDPDQLDRVREHQSAGRPSSPGPICTCQQLRAHEDICTLNLTETRSAVSMSVRLTDPGCLQ